MKTFLISILGLICFLGVTEGILAQNISLRPRDGTGCSADCKAKSTGQTTGHIANITLKNKCKSMLTTLPQTVYIPSSGEYQSYVAEIPGTNLPPGETTTIAVNGYCVDVNTPPVPNGDPMPPIDTWLPVGDPDTAIPEGSVNIIPTTPEAPFELDDIPGIITSPGYTPVAPNPDADIIITWPGTDILVGGTIDPAIDPLTFAPVIVKVVDVIEEGADSIQQGGLFTTPFSSDPPKERESIIQHVIWIYTSALSGKEYTKDIFASNVRDQFHDNTGKTVTSLPEDQKEKMDEGIDAFWETFTAVGVEAKVLSKTESTTKENKK